MKRLVIIDGKSVFYRGYYAMGNLATSQGTPTGGVYGFAAIAMELVKVLAPTKVVVAWDKAKTSTAKRKAIFADYKAGRVKPPADFYAQIPLLKELVAALGWGFLECDNYEADDIIGTLARQADEDLDGQGVCKWETYIISSDLDMLQIVDENTRMYRLLTGFSRLEEFSVPEVEAKYGILQKQFLDLKALKGDASDNIPGVPGVGEKGAVKLLNEFGSLDGIYEHIDEIKGAVREKLVAGKDSAYMSYTLAKIMTDAPVSLMDVPDLVVDEAEMARVLTKLEFYSLLKKFGLAPMEAEDEAVEVTREDLPEGMLVAWDVKERMHRDDGFAEKVLAGEKYWDLGQGKFLLDPLARKEKSEPVAVNLFDAAGKTGEEMDAEERGREYWRQQEMYKRYPKLYKVLTELDLPLVPVLYKMEKRGMGIDREYFARLAEEYRQKVDELSAEIWRLSGQEFNIQSPLQLSEVLFEKLRLPMHGIKKTSRGYSTGAKELEKLRAAHPVVPLLMKYREASKLLSTYVLPFPELAGKDGRVHTTFTQNVTATGRLSSLNPNMQNIPTRTEEGKKIRDGFVAGEGKVLVSADYSQFELRLAAALAGDEALIEDFNSGVDIHKKTAAEAFGLPMEEVTKAQRRVAKVINFGIIYGMSAMGLSEATGMGFGEAKRFIARYMELRAPIKRKMDEYLAMARGQGYVETLFGRRRPTPDVNSKNAMVRTAAERAAQNMPIQGTEADLMKKAMVAVDEALPEGAELVMQVHDSLIVECDAGLAGEVERILREKMEGVMPELPVRLAVDISSGQRWGSL